MLSLSIAGLKDKKAWEDNGTRIPKFDIEEVSKKTKENPRWVHIGPGTLFRGFIAAIAQDSIEQGLMDSGITVLSTYTNEFFDKIYVPYDNLILQVQMHANGFLEKAVIGSVGEALRIDQSWERAKEIFAAPGLQMVSFTITEKGYNIRSHTGEFFPFVQEEFSRDPVASPPNSTMGIVAALLYSRYKAGKYPIAVVSMDNFSHNGDKLKDSVLTISKKWIENNLVEKDFVDYLLSDAVSFPWTVIDKITPRPDPDVAQVLEKEGFENLPIIITSNKTHVAPFVNAEVTQYLIMEDKFPNGRPEMNSRGVHFTDRETVDKVEMMKVCVCLNPLHTAMSVIGCVLGFTKISDEMKDPDIVKLIKGVSESEGMKVVVDPGIIKPEDFLKEVLEERFPNPYIPDTPQRIATDTSQKVAIRFGNTIKSYVSHPELDPKSLKYIPFAIAGWCRYLLGVDDEGNAFELSPDPMLEELKEYLSGIEFGKPESVKDQLKPILSNDKIFGIDLYQVGLADKIVAYFKEMIAGPGATRKALKKLVNS